MVDTKTNKVLVNVLLDRSSSMGTRRAVTVSGYNEYLHGLRDDKETEYYVSLIQFDSTATDPQLTISYIDKALGEVPDLTMEGYVPRGTTPLYDAIGECCRRVEAKGRVVINVIITDGEENASVEFTKETIRLLVAQKEVEGQTFVYLGCNIDSYAESGIIGVSSSNTSNFSASRVSVAYDNLARSTRNKAANVRSSGLCASNAVPYFTMEQRVAMGGDLPTGTDTFHNPVTPNIGGVPLHTTFHSVVTSGNITPVNPATAPAADPKVAPSEKPRGWETTPA